MYNKKLDKIQEEECKPLTTSIDTMKKSKVSLDNAFIDRMCKLESLISVLETILDYIKAFSQSSKK